MVCVCDLPLSGARCPTPLENWSRNGPFSGTFSPMNALWRRQFDIDENETNCVNYKYCLVDGAFSRSFRFVHNICPVHRRRADQLRVWHLEQTAICPTPLTVWTLVERAMQPEFRAADRGDIDSAAVAMNAMLACTNSTMTTNCVVQRCMVSVQPECTPNLPLSGRS